MTESTPDRFEAQLDTNDFPDFNYPFALRFGLSMDLGGESLRVQFSTENTGEGPAPAGLGFHPYVLRRLNWRDDDLMLVLPAQKVYPARDCIPTAPAEPVSGKTDLRSLRRLGARDLDHCFTDLTGQEVRIIYPGSRTEVRFAFDDSFSHFVVYAPTTHEGDPASYVAVEPVTHVNNGFNLRAQGWESTGVRILSPGEVWTACWEISMGDI